ncbi:H-2 class II histocompatibility antigen, A-Q alpha chain-like [Pangasianodon hypophthalmus]|uniref:H-2 class II histocompatibility antigen, A-Q alpha chain-like n=1 Tax=Pangasianodon hypophthalmus TaxID=310915 RepID=UPI00230835E5|nr:H-2 class II histocompatibility antigen, A-Q alpha chain-like [Pangasianodon hypophthalmus]
MKLCVILVILTILPANTVFVYKFTILSGCSDSMDEAILLYSLDQDEIVLIDYKTKKQISRLPPFADPIDFEDLYDFAVAKRTECIQNIKNVTAAIGRPSEPRDPPEISVYPRHDVVPGEKNIFICFVKNFYPPHIRVNWTRNGVSVTEGVYISQFSINSDGTFNLFSTLTSSPNEGDEYSCTVEHQALDSPQTRTWDESVVTPPETPSVTPTVVFAVGIAVGILGLATGMFFVIQHHVSVKSPP